MKTALTAALAVCILMIPQLSGQSAHAEAPAGATATRSTDTAWESDQAFVITGDLSAMFASGEMVIYRRSAKAKGGGMGMAMSMSSASSATPSDSPGGPGTELVGRAELVDGKFTIEGEADTIEPVYFHVSEGVSHKGMRMGPVKGQKFILEPGALTMTMDELYNWSVNGHYNDIVFNSWKTSDAYLVPKTQMRTLPRLGEDEAEISAYNKKLSALQTEFIEAEYGAREKIATTHPDMLARELAITTGYIIFGWEIDAVRGILKEDPDNQWAKDYVALWEARKAKRESEGTRVAVGDYAKYFDAKLLDGSDVSLRDVCADNKYVLLEFWASWCGPCRAEIPNMKKAYTKYHDGGFEIFSFTIDKDKAAWSKASIDEELPWIDTGFGQESKPKKLYQVTGVPNNYLIDCSTGKVIAVNLRGEALDEKLQELF